MTRKPRAPWLSAAAVAALLAPGARGVGPIPSAQPPMSEVNTAAEPMQAGRFEPTWKSLQQYQTPEWFRDAKFGIWAHWGPQCQPEAGDWYARSMYIPGNRDYKAHLERYGHPSQAGFKEVIHDWKAERWDPEKLVALYKRSGAQYFFAMGNHHDNLDLWDSKHHAWNSVRVGPHKDLLAGWAAAARRQGLPFGVSLHAAHAWLWYEVAQGADRDGARAGVPYDGKLGKADGKGLWWEGLDPQELYAQNHAPSRDFQNPGAIHGQWNWGNGASRPDAAYCQSFYDRTVDLINRYDPDLLYFDDTALPLWPVSDAGLKIAAHLYNRSIARHGGELRAVLFGKILDDEQRKAITWDVERGAPNQIVSPAWQTDTCIGGWHYDRALYNRSGYKSAAAVVRMLADIVSKNGNLLLNIPVRGDGTIDEKEERVLEGIGAWMAVNREAIVGTRPWRIFGEGPASEGAAMSAQGFNEGKGKPLTAEDIRFTTRGETLYAIVLGVPAQPVQIRALAAGSPGRPVAAVDLLGASGPATWRQTGEALVIQPPASAPAGDAAVVYRITFAP